MKYEKKLEDQFYILAYFLINTRNKNYKSTTTARKQKTICKGLLSGFKGGLFVPNSIQVWLPQSYHAIISCGCQGHPTHVPFHLPYLIPKLTNIQLLSNITHTHIGELYTHPPPIFMGEGISIWARSGPTQDSHFSPSFFEKTP